MRQLPSQWRQDHFQIKPLDMSKGYLRFFEPDVLIQTRPDQFERLGLDDGQSFEKRRYYSLDRVIRREAGMEADLDVGLNMCCRYQHLFKTEFQFKKRKKPRILSFREGSKADTAFFEAAFGYFPKEELPYFSELYCRSLETEEAAPSAQTWLEIVERRAGYPLYYTCRDMEVQSGHRSNPAIFIFDPSKPSDVIDFWNFRIFTPTALPVNSRWLAQSREFIGRFIRQNYRPLPGNRNGVMINASIHIARSLDLKSVIDELNLTEFELPKNSCTFQDWYQPVWQAWDDDDRVLRPTASILSALERDIQITPTGEGRIMLRFPTLAPEFDGGAIGAGPKWVNTVAVKQYSAKPDIALVLPSAGFEGKRRYPSVGLGKQFVSREGFVTFQQFAHDEAYLELPSPAQAITSWLAADGIEAKPSDAGRVAEQIIESVGGLGGTHAFRDKRIVELLDKMARNRREYSDGSSDEFGDRTATVQEWLKVLGPLQKRTWGRWRTLDTLVERGMLRLGLSLNCTHCTQANWYSIDEVESHIRCSRCLKQFLFPQGNSKAANWAYRVIGPFATPHFARGAYTVALALRFLDDELGSFGNLTFSTGIELSKDGVTKEADFYAWRSADGFSRASRSPLTLIGECKSLGSDSFKDADINNLKHLAELIPGAYLITASMKDRLSTDELSRLRELAAWGWSLPRPSPLIVLTGLELFGDGPLSHDWKEAGGRAKEAFLRHQHIFDFPTLAAATQELHLEMEPEVVADLQYGPRRRVWTSANQQSRSKSSQGRAKRKTQAANS
ncbi:hypothetical protein KK137_09870 [Croceibacterium sp. LX-88]|uniref:Uncharacterized protein n=1 Tax=Croceibacterium selenioxidans TaxID=2838833 RepID=A0ABS5W5Z1_9SPHN|nr:hypothetical protein [Croceibacterium selenioxidans]MBT2134640.1 hypothetical protein [Croceibacterium selenioxidans]